MLQVVAVGRGEDKVVIGGVPRGARDVFERAGVFETGRQAGLDRGELEGAIQDPEVKQALRRATDAAFELGVIGVPTLAIDDELFWGDDRLEDAAATLRA